MLRSFRGRGAVFSPPFSVLAHGADAAGRALGQGTTARWWSWTKPSGSSTSPLSSTNLTRRIEVMRASRSVLRSSRPTLTDKGKLSLTPTPGNGLIAPLQEVGFSHRLAANPDLSEGPSVYPKTQKTD